MSIGPEYVIGTFRLRREDHHIVITDSDRPDWRCLTRTWRAAFRWLDEALKG